MENIPAYRSLWNKLKLLICLLSLLFFVTSIILHIFHFIVSVFIFTFLGGILDYLVPFGLPVPVSLSLQVV